MANIRPSRTRGGRAADLRLLTIPEYSTRAYRKLPPEFALALAKTGAVGVAMDLQGRTQLTSTSYVGVVRAGEVELRIKPKLRIRRLLWLIGYASDPKGWRDEQQVDLLEIDDLVAAMAVSFVAASTRALARGLMRGYRVTEEASITLRGRLREADQVRRRLSVALPLEVRYDDYTVNIPENQLLLSAALRLRHLSGLPPNTRGAIHRLMALMGEVTPLIPGQQLPTPRFDQLNRHYRPAILLARLILSGKSLEQPPGATTAAGFLFDLNLVFEQWLSAALREALLPYGGYLRAQWPGHLDVGKSISLRPDMVWERGGKPAAVVDAKYKSLHLDAAGPNPDLYQMLAYCTVFGLRAGHLVYAAGEQTPSRCVVINTKTTISTWAMHLDKPVTELMGEVNQLATTLSLLSEQAMGTAGGPVAHG
jgi:5-methylcytosine-specific restriction enzyme subunit McrC